MTNDPRLADQTKSTQPGERKALRRLLDTAGCDVSGYFVDQSYTIADATAAHAANIDVPISADATTIRRARLPNHAAAS